MSLLIPGTNSIKDTGYDVANSCRFNSADSPKMVKTLGTPTSTKICTVSCWIKRGSIGVEQHFFGTKQDGNDRCSIGFDDSAEGELHIVQEDSGSYSYRFKTTARYRDPSAWMHLVLAIDTTQASANNRVKIYVNGSQVTSFATETQPAQDTVIRYGISGEELVVGAKFGGGGSYGTFYNGYLAEVVFIDGLQLDPTSFGEFDSDSPNIWKPINVSGLTFGNNGFHLDFEDSSNLGNDANGGTDLTVSNLSATDQSTDTCTNNFCVMNPLYPDGTITFSEGNLKLTQGSSWRSAGGTMAVSTGKWYWEISNVGNFAYIGFADIQLFNEGCSIRESFTTGAATTGKAHSVLNSDGRHYQVTSAGAQTSEYPSAATFPTFTNSTIGIALNLDDNNFIFYKDGTAMNPSGTAISITAGNYIPAVSIYGNNVSYNFGSPPYSISSGNSDANGHGNFEYSVPSGYFALCTKNLAESG